MSVLIYEGTEATHVYNNFYLNEPKNCPRERLTVLVESSLCAFMYDWNLKF